MWSKRATPEFFASMRGLLSPEQRLAVQRIVAQMEADPRDEVWRPILLDRNMREIDFEGLWLRYRLDERGKEIIFIRVSL